jgi:rhodanese-related sulfurtransferase
MGSKCAMCSQCRENKVMKTHDQCAKDGCCASGVCVAKKHNATSAAMEAGVINTEALEALMRVKTPMTVLDARSAKYAAGNRLPGAKALAADATEAQMAAMLPEKQALVVTYCVNLKCPASHMLGERLRKLGYVNVLEYREGIEGWMAAGKTVEKVTR